MSSTVIRLTVVLTASLLAIGPTAAQTPRADTGGADFSKFVAIGDSLTAGWADGGLSMSAQELSLPSLIFRRVYGGAAGFEQPWISEPGIPPRLVLTGLFPTVISPRPGLGSPVNLALPRPYDNLGIPGADVDDVLNRLTDGGGLFDVVLRGQGTMLQQALRLQPTFASVWVGNNDALGAATAGTPALLTPLPDFDDDYTAMIDALMAAGVDLVIANVPDVTSIPFVTTVPPILVDPVTNQPVLVNGMPVPLIGPTGAPLTAGDRVLLTATSVLALGCGIPFPIGLAGGSGPFPAECPDGLLPDAVVLDAAEITQIQDATRDYNAVIAREAGRAGAALVDMFSVLQEVAGNGLVIGGVDYGADFLTGGVFSYDGVHPSAFGYAFAANEFIAAINETYGARIPLVDLRPFVFGGAGGGSASPMPAALARGARVTDDGLHNLLVGLGVRSGEPVVVERPDPTGEATPVPDRFDRRRPSALPRPTGALRERYEPQRR